jgi:hypothetical protein
MILARRLMQFSCNSGPIDVALNLFCKRIRVRFAVCIPLGGRMNLLSIVSQGRVVLGCVLALTVTLAAGANQGSSSQSAITKKIDETRMTRLVGNVRPEATRQNDRGSVGDSMQLQHLQLLLQRPADSEAALAAYMDISRRRAIRIITTT